MRLLAIIIYSILLTGLFANPKIIKKEDLHGIIITNFYYIENGSKIRRDAVELKPKYTKIFEKIDEQVEKELRGHKLKGQRGFIHVFWDKKEEILKDQYKVIWRSPRVLNPGIKFD